MTLGLLVKKKVIINNFYSLNNKKVVLLFYQSYRSYFVSSCSYFVLNHSSITCHGRRHHQFYPHINFETFLAVSDQGGVKS